MGKINVLDSVVYNRIAAGEVVERPASIVKELVENSIDAGARSISIDVENGGIDRIRVADNGSGMAPEDVPLAFMPHATSKIRSVSDLDEIGTLGFRGEALPSIAAVAHVTLVSRRADAELGYGIKLENGTVLDEGERGCPFGTTIVVRNIFGNIPARKKFLAKSFVEQNEISNIITRFVLANPSVAFKYTVDGKLIYNTDGQGTESALYAVYGRDFYDNMLSVRHAMSDIVLRGYIGKPYYTKHNRMFQTLIVNGRYVINADVSYCVYECCSDFLMKRQYPVFVLYLELPHDMVDVNIHPNKLDVKFANLPLVKKVVSNAVRVALGTALTDPQTIKLSKNEEQTERRTIEVPRSGAPVTTQIIKHVPASLREPRKRSIFDGPPAGQEAATSCDVYVSPSEDSPVKYGRIQLDPSTKVEKKGEPYAWHDAGGDRAVGGEGAGPVSAGAEKRPEETARHAAATSFDRTENAAIVSKADLCGQAADNSMRGSAEAGPHDVTGEVCAAVDRRENPAGEFRFAEQATLPLSGDQDYRIIGCLFRTYILVEADGAAYMIDQHAAHERLLFEEYRSQIEKGAVAVQPLLVPFVYPVSHGDMSLLRQRDEDLRALGFSIRSEGTAMLLDAVPVVVSNMDMQDFLPQLLQSLSRTSVTSSTLLRDALMQAACKAAVKGDEELSRGELAKLLRQVIQTGAPLYCPHGRPIAVRFERKELEKWFKRIV